MESGLPRPPSFATWLLLTVCALFVAAAFYGGPAITAAVAVALTGLAATLFIVIRWVGRVASLLTQDLVEGYREGYEKERVRSAARLASGDGSAETP